MKILLAILLLLAGLVIGAIGGFFGAADPPAPYMEFIPQVEQVATALEGAQDEDERKRLCAEFRELVASLAAAGAPSSIVDAGRQDLAKHCAEEAP